MIFRWRLRSIQINEILSSRTTVHTPPNDDKSKQSAKQEWFLVGCVMPAFVIYAMCQHCRRWVHKFEHVSSDTYKIDYRVEILCED